MEKKVSYIPLLTAWEQYLALGKNAGLTHFAQWILNKDKKNSALQEDGLDEYFDKNSSEHQYAEMSPEASFLLWRMSKFIRLYTKPILAEAGLAGQDDFAILSHVDYKQICSKKEAIEANLIDPTTGIEIIKRLVQQGLIIEKLNKEDKRQRLVSLSRSGQAKLKQLFVGFSGIQDVLAEMNTAERKTLLSLLKKLDAFHTNNLETQQKLPKK